MSADSFSALKGQHRRPQRGALMVVSPSFGDFRCKKELEGNPTGKKLIKIPNHFCLSSPYSNTFSPVGLRFTPVVSILRCWLPYGSMRICLLFCWPIVRRAKISSSPNASSPDFAPLCFISKLFPPIFFTSRLPMSVAVSLSVSQNSPVHIIVEYTPKLIVKKRLTGDRFDGKGKWGQDMCNVACVIWMRLVSIFPPWR